jgi:hypothetical protein
MTTLRTQRAAELIAMPLRANFRPFLYEDRQHPINRRAVAELDAETIPIGLRAAARAAAEKREQREQQILARRVVWMEEKGVDPQLAYTDIELEWLSEAISERRAQRAAELA